MHRHADDDVYLYWAAYYINSHPVKLFRELFHCLVTALFDSLHDWLHLYTSRGRHQTAVRLFASAMQPYRLQLNFRTVCKIESKSMRGLVNALLS